MWFVQANVLSLMTDGPRWLLNALIPLLINRNRVGSLVVELAVQAFSFWAFTAFWLLFWTVLITRYPLPLAGPFKQIRLF